MFRKKRIIIVLSVAVGLFLLSCVQSFSKNEIQGLARIIPPGWELEHVPVSGNEVDRVRIFSSSKCLISKDRNPQGDPHYIHSAITIAFEKKWNQNDYAIEDKKHQEWAKDHKLYSSYFRIKRKPDLDTHLYSIFIIREENCAPIRMSELSETKELKEIILKYFEEFKDVFK